jgi:hypothetical protein
MQTSGTSCATLTAPAEWLPIVNGTWPDVKPSMTRVMSVHLDKGNYVITTQVIVGNYSGQGVIVCLLGNDSLGYSVVQSGVGSTAGFALQQTLDAQEIFKLAEAEDLVLSCFNAPPNTPAGTPGIGYAAVIATNVAEVTPGTADAHRAVQPRVLHLREEARAEPQSLIAGIPTKQGFDRDEYQPAMWEEGARGQACAPATVSRRRLRQSFRFER